MPSSSSSSCAVAVDDGGVGQCVAQLQAALLLLLDDLHCIAHVGQQFCQIIGGLAAAQDHNFAGTLLQNAQHPQELFDLLRGGGDADAVAALELKAAVGDVHVLPSLDGADKDFGLGSLWQVF